MGMNKIPPLLLVVFSVLPLVAESSKPPHEPPQAAAQLSKDYYAKTCPRFHEILNEQVIAKQTAAPTTAAAVLRVFFHDCMVDGCDASTLVASNSFMKGKTERDADINMSLPGDSFDIVTRAKTALEIECPGVVSCADILSESARILVMMTGGPRFEILLGRKDSLVSEASRVIGNLALPNMTLTHIIDLFKIKGFTVQEMVALVGAHTIGFSHCSQFSHRIFNFSKTQPFDPKMNPKLADGLRRLCANYTKDPAMAAFNDVRTPGKFDNMYYRNLKSGLGLLATDQAMADDPRTRPIVDLYATNENAFFNDFAKAMEKLSVLQIKTGNQGEVRHRCDQFNNMLA